MKRAAPKTEIELALMVERALADVPLTPAEIREVGRETGINAKRLALRLQTRVEEIHKSAQQRAAIIDADRNRPTAVAQVQEQLGRPRKRLPAKEARSHLRQMRSVGGAPLEAHFHKLDQMSEDDLNQLIEEVELLMSRKSG